MKMNRIRRRVRAFSKRLPGVALELLNPVELLGEVINDPRIVLPILVLLGALALLLLIAAAFFGIILDSFDRTPLQTLGLN